MENISIDSILFLVVTGFIAAFIDSVVGGGDFKVWSRAQADIDRIAAIWKESLSTYGGPYLFGK